MKLVSIHYLQKIFSIFALIFLFYSVNTYACTPIPLPTLTYKDVYRGICYGDATWKELAVTGHPILQQNFDYFPVKINHPVPLVIWGHPNGSTRWLDSDSTLYNALIKQARDQGFAFISLEFRHPVGNDYIIPAPHLDFAHAIQFIRANAQALNIDTNNIFLVGQSRGTLGLWTALQPDMADPTSTDINAQQSTRVNAVFGYQAQTTYDGREFADLFIIPSDRPLVKSIWEQEHPQYALFGSAIKSVDVTDPPVLLRYEATFVNHLVSAQYMLGTEPIIPNTTLIWAWPCAQLIAKYWEMLLAATQKIILLTIMPSIITLIFLKAM